MELNTRYGTLTGCIHPEYYEDGAIESCSFSERNELSLSCGTLVPQYGGADQVRRKYVKSADFYRSGALRRLALEEQTEVETPIGDFPAELLTFYEDGAVRRVFPLNGKISGYWSEQDEARLLFPFHFEFYFGAFSAKIVSVHFYPNGSIRSITLFPGEVVALNTPAGEIPVRTGFSLYESGALESVELAQPTPVLTPIGRITAFDALAVGVHADSNSLRFSESGAVTGIATSSEKIIVQSKAMPLTSVSPVIKPDLTDEEETFLCPVTVRFEGESVVLSNGETTLCAPGDAAFTVIQSRNAACSSCAGCAARGVCGKTE